MLVFINESGDQGLGPNSSPYMILAMVIFKNEKDAKATDDVIRNLRYNVIKKKEFRFKESTPSVRDAFFNAISPRKFDVRAIVFSKDIFLQLVSELQLNSSKGQFLYYLGLDRLLKSYSLKNAKVRLDKKSDPDLRISLKNHMNVLNSATEGMIEEYGMKDSESDNLIQLADMVVGAIARSYDSSKPNHDRWHQNLKLKKNEIVEII